MDFNDSDKTADCVETAGCATFCVQNFERETDQCVNLLNQTERCEGISVRESRFGRFRRENDRRP